MTVNSVAKSSAITKLETQEKFCPNHPESTLVLMNFAKNEGTGLPCSPAAVAESCGLQLFPQEALAASSGALWWSSLAQADVHAREAQGSSAGRRKREGGGDNHTAQQN